MILTAKIAFADQTESKIDGSPQIALKCKPTTGEADFRVWVSATHKDQASLKPGALILADVDNGKAKYVGLAPADAATPATQPTSAPQAAAKEPVTLEQVTQTWLSIYNHLANTLPDQDEKSRRKSATTVFIAACQAGAFWKG